MLWIVGAIILGLVILFVIAGNIVSFVGWRIPFEQVHDYVDSLMRYGEHGDRLLLRASGGRIEFVKLIPGSTPTRFLLSLDRRFGSAEDFAAAKAWLKCQGINFQDVSCREHCDEHRQLLVEIGRDVQLGTRVALGLFTEVLAIPREAKIRFGHIAGMVVRRGVEVGWGQSGDGANEAPGS